MKINSVEFIGAIGQPGQSPPDAARGLPQLAFSGRSNVGKSSLINRVTGRTRTAIARVSQQPGKTQEINFYRVRTDRGDFLLVDLPGYGYARVPRELKNRWEPLIRGYLGKSEELAGVVQLIDARRGATEDDLRAVSFLGDLGVPVLFALTKADKLKRSGVEAALRRAARELEVDSDQIVPFSAPKGTGREELLESIEALLFADDAPQPPSEDG
ncbi:ribosome biogenesis GTP-binding protein YihA/YsxC [soil metagenome]